MLWPAVERRCRVPISSSSADPIPKAAGVAAEPRFAVVIAVFNEADNVAAVTEEVLRAAAPLGPFELVYVDDGSNDATAEHLRVLRSKNRAVRVLRHGRRCGK